MFEVHEGVGCGTGALDGPVALAAALVAVSGPAAPAGQAVIRSNVASMMVRPIQCFEEQTIRCYNCSSACISNV